MLIGWFTNGLLVGLPWFTASGVCFESDTAMECRIQRHRAVQLAAPGCASKWTRLDVHLRVVCWDITMVSSHLRAVGMQTQVVTWREVFGYTWATDSE